MHVQVQRESMRRVTLAVGEMQVEKRVMSVVANPQSALLVQKVLGRLGSRGLFRSFARYAECWNLYP